MIGEVQEIGMRNIKNFKAQVRETLLKELATLELETFDELGQLEDFVASRLYDIGTELLPEYVPEGTLSNQAAISLLIAVPDLLDAEWIGNTPRENICPALRSMTADQLGEELGPGLREKFDAYRAATARIRGPSMD